MKKASTNNQVNIRALAEELNLSIGTISKALNDSHEISAKTKARVIDLVNQRNYIPNAYASNLRKRKSNTIAVVVPDVADSFFSLAIKGIEHVAQTKGYHVLIYLTYESYEKELQILKEIISGRVDGVLVSVACETSGLLHFQTVKEKNIPIVFFDRSVDLDTTKIVTDDYHSSYAATEHLINKNCRNIKYLSVSSSIYFSINNNRMEGFRQALKDHNLPCDDSAIIQCSNDTAENYGLIKDLLAPSDRPDGLILSVEKLVIPLYKVCDELQLNIPDSIKPVCFTNLKTAPILSPSLTTVEQPAHEIGKTAADMLFKALGKRPVPLKDETIQIPSKLIIRNSTCRSAIGF
jgi:LacI family transcriptional regulator